MADQPSSNTFGTFLETFNGLSRAAERAPALAESSLSAVRALLLPDNTSEQAVLQVVAATGLYAEGKPLRDVIADSGLAKPVFLKAMEEGQAKGLLQLDASAEPRLILTPTGRAFAE